MEPKMSQQHQQPQQQQRNKSTMNTNIKTNIKTKTKQLKLNKAPPSTFLFIKAGLPLILFSVGASIVVKKALDGKFKEADASQRYVSKSERQARLEKEQDDMLSKINKIRKTDFNNTKRIERPEEILERRKKERAVRNVWYRRAWRKVTFQS